MKVLWITNAIFPEPSKKLGLPIPVFGGWMYGLAQDLSCFADIELAVATIYDGTDLKVFYEKGIHYYLLPSKYALKYQSHLEVYWREVCNVFNPDIIHINGTEYPHGLACMKSQPNKTYVISIQGILSVCQRYYLGGLSNKEIINNITFRDIVRMDNLFQSRMKMQNRSKWEKQYFTLTKNVIGRTTWDKSHSLLLSKTARYHFCNESLREEFYTSTKWKFDNCKKYTIFLSQAGYPLKGFHQVLKAVALLKIEFPTITINIAGHNISNVTTLMDKLRMSGYGKYISKLIKQLDLGENVNFTGELNEEQMVQAYLNSHVFICPSIIENSPNSLGEAQILGVPCIAAYVGGVPDMIIHGETGIMYRFEEVEMLANYIRILFTESDLAKKISSSGIIAAETRHNRLINKETMRAIYSNLSN